MPDYPTGTVTLVFTDIEDSSVLFQKHGNAFQAAMEAHNRLLREVASHWNGFEVKTEGDAFFLTFDGAVEAAQFALEAQRRLLGIDWPAVLAGLEAVRVRIGLHTGQPLVQPQPSGAPDYFGPAVNRA